MVNLFTTWHQWRIATAVLLVLVLYAAPADAQEGMTLPLEKLVTEAELIFEGTVEKIQYVNSAPAGEKQKPIPHTFVTYRTEKVFKGRPAGEKSITLRFMGGPLGKSRFLMLSRMPAIDEGDRDILFVRGNGKSLCPLVGWDQGRIRVIDGKVYDEYGHALVRSNAGDLLLGRQHEKKAVIKHYVGGTQFNRIARETDPGDAEEKAVKEKKRAPEKDFHKTEELDYKSFTSHLSATMGKYYDERVLANVPVTVSTDPREKFTVDLKPAPFRKEAR